MLVRERAVHIPFQVDRQLTITIVRRAENSRGLIGLTCSARLPKLMSRAVYLIIFHSPIFPAHWAMYIPHTATAGRGTLINVRGDPSTGFCHEFERNYDPDSTTSQKKLLHLCDVEERCVVDVIGDGTASIDTYAVDDVERTALQVCAPPKTLRSSDDPVSAHSRQIACNVGSIDFHVRQRERK